uniref:Uncharacterized protein n=1 Tax=Tetranychus urticae TaxID=32264 RepID=T1JU44_TETUR
MKWPTATTTNMTVNHLLDFAETIFREKWWKIWIQKNRLSRSTLIVHECSSATKNIDLTFKGMKNGLHQKLGQYTPFYCFLPSISKSDVLLVWTYTVLIEVAAMKTMKSSTPNPQSSELNLIYFEG